jgi:hypothetical protein
MSTDNPTDAELFYAQLTKRTGEKDPTKLADLIVDKFGLEAKVLDESPKIPLQVAEEEPKNVQEEYVPHKYDSVMQLTKLQRANNLHHAVQSSVGRDGHHEFLFTSLDKSINLSNKLISSEHTKPEDIIYEIEDRKVVFLDYSRKVKLFEVGSDGRSIQQYVHAVSIDKESDLIKGMNDKETYQFLKSQVEQVYLDATGQSDILKAIEQIHVEFQNQTYNFEARKEYKFKPNPENIEKMNSFLQGLMNL